MFTTYILRSLDNGKYYIGHTNDIERRLKDHNRGKDHASKTGAPWVLVREEKFNTRKEAIYRERYIKSLKSRKRIEKIIAG